MNDLASVKLPQKKPILIKQTNFQLSTAPRGVPLCLKTAWSYCPTLFPKIARMSERNAEIQVGGDFFPFWQWKIQGQQKNK